MKQSYPVYLTNLQTIWIDYAIPVAVGIGLLGVILNKKWRVIPSHREDMPEMTRNYLDSKNSAKLLPPR
ncbi:MAG: hypothetical protein ABI443_08850 [Chthoniobacterales bacterium]